MLFRSPKPQTPNPKPQTPNPLLQPEHDSFNTQTVSVRIINMRYPSLSRNVLLLFVVIITFTTKPVLSWNFGDIISEDTMTRVTQDQSMFECKTNPCDHNLCLQYWWAFDETYKHFKKYSYVGKLSFNTKLAIIASSIRRIFRHKTAIGFYLVRQLKDREILELGPLHTEELPPPFIEYDHGIIGKAWATKEMKFAQNATEYRNTFPDEYHFPIQPKSELAFPIVDKDTDKVVAVYYHALDHDHFYQLTDFLGIKILMNLIDWY